MKVAFFITMTELWKILTDRGRVNWFLLCQQHDVTLSENDERDISIQTKVEDLEEIAKIMQEPPNYTISKQGRG